LVTCALAATLASIVKKKNFVLIIFLVFNCYYFLQLVEIVLYTYSQTQTTFIKQSPAAILSSLPLSRFLLLFVGFSKKENVNFSSDLEVVRNPAL
jgi:hypothetical protein